MLNGCIFDKEFILEFFYRGLSWGFGEIGDVFMEIWIVDDDKEIRGEGKYNL